MLEIIYFIVSLVAIILLYKENLDLKSKLEKLQEHYEKLEKKHEITEHTQHNLIKVNAQIHEELKKLSADKIENERLKQTLIDNNISY